MSAAHRMYAQALFEAAQERGRLERVAEELSAFALAVQEVPELRSVLRSPQLDPKAKISILRDLLGEADELVRNFLLLVAEKGRAGEFEQIQQEFERLVERAQRRLEVQLTTAYELSDEEAAGIIAQIEASSGRKVEATRSVDPALIGGLVLQAGSMRVDASIRGRLTRLRRELVAG